jgi:hypothetical protein
MTGREATVSAALDGVAKRLGASIYAVALAYAMQKAPYVFPVLGGFKISQLKTNIEALSLRLSVKDVAEIEKGYAFDAGFPHNFTGLRGKVPRGGPEDSGIVAGMGYFDYVEGTKAVKPHQGELDVAWEA